MTIKSILELIAQANATIEDNTAGAISAADVRNLFKDFLDTMSPAYGSINAPSIVQALTASPVSLKPFTQILANTTGYYNANVTQGQVTREVTTASIAGATDFVLADGAVEGPQNDIVTIALYKNGAPVGFAVTVTTAGAGRPVGWNIAALTYSNADAAYQLFVSGSVGSKTFTEVTMIVQAQPVRSFV